VLPRPAAALEERTEEIMDRVQKAGDNHVERVAAPEEYLTLTRAHEGETWFDAGAWTEDLADSYLALGRVDDAVRTISNTTGSGYAEGAEMPCELAEKLTRSGHEPQARPLWQQARAEYPDDVWIYVQADIGYDDIGDHAEALEWLTTGLTLALRTGDPESALEQLRPSRASCLSALGRRPAKFRSERPRANRGKQLSDKRSALDALSAAEKATVLDELLAARPDLRELAEAYAAQVMMDADRSAVAGDVKDALQGLDIEELNTRAGYRPGRGYVHPAEAADEILDEALQPFLDDLQRRAGLGTRSAAVELAAGTLLGLYNCRHSNSETLLEYCPDYAAERASGVVSDCARLGIELPTVELLDLMPEWSALLH
jgi:tetratricopeptide (TPR) repeat protein